MKKQYAFRFEPGDVDLWKQCAEAFGISLSEWIRRQCNNSLNGKTNEDRPTKNVRRPREFRVVQQCVDPVPATARMDTCPHGKQKGGLCYKCDPQFGNPVIGETAAKPRHSAPE